MESKPHCLLVLGMAGSGKTTFVRKLYSMLKLKDENLFAINLDPAINKLSFPANLDICDSINLKKLMKDYSLGPNGAIVTALNLYSTQFHSAVEIVSQKEAQYVLIDTPGQIETFTWSASGTIITDALASQFPTSIIYVVDTTRCQHPSAFMSNMLYATSIYYKTRLPILLVFNKTDVTCADFAFDWMSDFETFMEALDSVSDESYYVSLNRSLALVLDEFYSQLNRVDVSSYTGFGFDQLLPMLSDLKSEYLETYLPELEAKRKHLQNQTHNLPQTPQEDLTPIKQLMEQLNLNKNN